MNLHIIYTGADVLVSKKSYSNWREVQDEYADYKASLGPWDVEAVIAYLTSEYPTLTSARKQIEGLRDSGEGCIYLQFND